MHNDDTQKDDYLVGQFLVFAILSIEACYEVIGSFEETEEEEISEKSDSSKKEFGIEKILKNSDIKDNCLVYARSLCQ